jgi:hypothetical protein
MCLAMLPLWNAGGMLTQPSMQLMPLTSADQCGSTPGDSRIPFRNISLSLCYCPAAVMLNCLGNKPHSYGGMGAVTARVLVFATSSSTSPV